MDHLKTLYKHLFIEPQSWLPLLTGIGIIITSVVAIITLRVVIRQTRSSYKPDLYLNSLPSSYKVVYEAKKQVIQCVLEKHTEKDLNMSGLLYSIENIGFGTAKNISIKWKFNFSKTYSLLEKKAKPPFNIQMHQKGLTVKKLTKDYTFLYHDPIGSTTYDFVLPRKDEVFKKSPHLPVEIVEAFTMFFIVKNNPYQLRKNYFLIHEDFNELPKIKAEVTYYDIGGKKHRKDLLASLSMSVYEEDLSELEEGDDLSIRLYFQFESEKYHLH